MNLHRAQPIQRSTCTKINLQKAQATPLQPLYYNQPAQGASYSITTSVLQSICTTRNLHHINLYNNLSAQRATCTISTCTTIYLHKAQPAPYQPVLQSTRPFQKGRSIMETQKHIPYSQHDFATKPTGFTRHKRQNLLWQFYRFLVLNIKMLRMVRLH
jgi:hypothetical protein